MEHVTEVDTLKALNRVLVAQLTLALGALADIALSDDMTLDTARKKAKRIHLDIRDATPFLEGLTEKPHD